MRTLIVVGAVFMSACGGGLNCDPNATMTYGDTGFPKNCRAIIAANINSWRAGDYRHTGSSNPRLIERLRSGVNRASMHPPAPSTGAGYWPKHWDFREVCVCAGGYCTHPAHGCTARSSA
jgi:hypothetical protein